MDLNFIVKTDEAASPACQAPSMQLTKTALIIDDSKLNQHMLGNMLQHLDYKIHLADDGEEGIEKFAEVRPSLTFLDIVMPKKSGLQVLNEIKLRNPKAVVVMVSSFTSKQNIHDAKKFGADWFLKKPLTKEKVEEIIKRIEQKK